MTAGNASGVNDGAGGADHRLGRRCQTPRPDPARACRRHGHRRRAAAHHGHGSRAGHRRSARTPGLKIGDIDVIELNEAFAAQGIAVLRQLGLPDDAEHVNPNGGAIALGHPLGMSGARLALTAVNALETGAANVPWPRCASASAKASPP